MTGDSYKGYLQNTINPTGWILRGKDEDYGIDNEIEIVDETGTVTGKVVWLQVKSTRDIKIVNDQVKYRLNIDFLQYVYKCDNPILLLIYDAENDIAYWLWLQRYIYQHEEVLESNHKTHTINIPAKNVFHNDLAEISEIAKNGAAFCLRYKLGILNSIIKNSPSSISTLSEYINRVYDKDKLYDGMHGWGWVSEVEIKAWFQAKDDEGTSVLIDTPIGKFKIFTPIAPDLLETLEEMKNYGMIEIKLENSPIPYAVLDFGGVIYKNKLETYNEEKAKWEPVDGYPEFVFKCKDIGRKLNVSALVDEIADSFGNDQKQRTYKYYLKKDSYVSV